MDIETIAATAKFIVDNRDKFEGPTNKVEEACGASASIPGLPAALAAADTKEKAGSLFSAIRSEVDKSVGFHQVSNHLAYRFFKSVEGGCDLIHRAVGR